MLQEENMEEYLSELDKDQSCSSFLYSIHSALGVSVTFYGAP